MLKYQFKKFPYRAEKLGVNLSIESLFVYTIYLEYLKIKNKN